MEVGQILGPAINKTTTAIIAQVAQRGMDGFSSVLLTFELVLVFLRDFLPRKPDGFLRAAGFRFDDDGFAGGGGGGSLVTLLMIRPVPQTVHQRIVDKCLI